MSTAGAGVWTGLEVAHAQGFATLRGLRVGLVANAATVDRHFRHAAELLVGGPSRRSGFASFVGLAPVATRHGLTLGELAGLWRAERGLGGEVTVVPCEGWHRDLTFDATGLPWVLPSANMPTLETAFV